MQHLEHPASGATAGRVLIVDDVPEIRRLLAVAFSGAGFEVVEAASVGAALSCLRQAWPDVAVLDFERSDTRGLDALHWIRACPEFDELPVLFLANVPDRALEWRALQVGADAFSGKPFSVVELIDRVGWLARNGRPCLRVIASTEPRRRAS